MITAPQVPGVRFEVQPRPAEPSPLRSDVAGLIGRTRRGPIGEAIRVEGYREFLGEFGPLLAESSFTYSVRGYFENGGQVAYVLRISGGNTETATADWDTWEQFGLNDKPNDKKLADVPLEGFRYRHYCIMASSPGQWGGRLRVLINYELIGSARRPTVNMTIRAPGEPTEHIRDLMPDVTPEDERQGQGRTMESRVAEASRLIRLLPDQSSEFEPVDRGRHHNRWRPSRLPFKLDAARPSRAEIQREYLQAIEKLGDRPEVAILALPGLYEDIKPAKGKEYDSEELKLVERRRIEIIRAAVKEAAELQDRLVLVDVPPDLGASGDPVSPVGFSEQLRRELTGGGRQRAAAIYHPRLLVSDPLGGSREPFRRVAASGHVAGVISRVDREQGAAQTPANVPVLDTVDVAETFAEDAGESVSGQGIVSLNEAGVNLIRCRPNRGLLVWGGRTLDRNADGKFVAHRRFIHRLVRVIRRVADPIVFDTNGPEAWLVLVSAVSTVLLEAFRSGALRGESPEEAFFVQCDEQTNPYPQREQGLLVCNIGLALAAPMEFITLRIALSESGQVEVFDQ